MWKRRRTGCRRRDLSTELLLSPFQVLMEQAIFASIYGLQSHLANCCEVQNMYTPGSISAWVYFSLGLFQPGSISAWGYFSLGLFQP